MKILLFIKRIALGILIFIGSLVVALGVLASFISFKPKVVEISSPSVLNLHLGESYLLEHERPHLMLGELAPVSSFTLRDVIKGIREAKTDDRIKGILLEIDGPYIGVAKAQEIREALEDFKTSGKFVNVFGKTYGEMSNGTIPYYLASIGHKIWIQPQGTLGLTGFIIEVPFAKDLLDTIGVSAQFGKRKGYKTLMDSFTEKGFTPEHKASVKSLASNLYHQVSVGIAKGRGMTEENVKHTINEGPFLGKEAIANGLIDAEGYIGDVKKEIEKKLSKKPSYIKLKEYLQNLERSEEGQEIAVVHVEGKITQQGSSEADPFGEVEAGDGEIAQALREVAENKNVKAIVLRVNSGGGSAVASETIWHEVLKASLSGKPVIGSMSDMAASGGYLVATPCSYIFAQEGTLTGSIGVISGKIVTEDLWKHLGIKWESVHEGANAGIDSSLSSFNHQGWEKLNRWLDDVYISFKKKVADGRKLSLTEVEKIAQGRVWTGQEALKSKLIDEIGGLDKAISYAKKKAGLKESDKVQVVDYPHIKTLSEHLMELFTSNTLQTQIRPLTYLLGFLGVLKSPLTQEHLEVSPFKVK